MHCQDLEILESMAVRITDKTVEITEFVRITETVQTLVGITSY